VVHALLVQHLAVLIDQADLMEPAAPVDTGEHLARRGRRAGRDDAVQECSFKAWPLPRGMLADPTRIKLLWALLQGESLVTCLAELVGAGPTAVSQHLAKLRLAGFVRGRRQGTFVYYTAADEHVRALLAEALFHAEHADQHLPDGVEHRHAPARFATRSPG
jgi:DNA-binding transcriptional ArsR family regulator